MHSAIRPRCLTLSGKIFRTGCGSGRRLALEPKVVGHEHTVRHQGWRDLSVGGKIHASRTVPFVSKATGVQLAKVAARCMVSVSLEQQHFTKEVIPDNFFCEGSDLPLRRNFPGVDTLLGPEMKSTGEVMVGSTLRASLCQSDGKAPEICCRRTGKALLSVRDADKKRVVKVLVNCADMSSELKAAPGHL